MINTLRLLNAKLFKEALESAEKHIYLEAYAYTGRNTVHAAKLLGVARGTMIARLRRWQAGEETA